MACMCYQLTKQTINFRNSGRFMVGTLEAYGFMVCVYSKQTISSSCLPYVPALKLACVCSLACVTARELGVEVVSLHQRREKSLSQLTRNVQTFLHSGQTNLSLHCHYDCPILVPYIAHCDEVHICSLQYSSPNMVTSGSRLGMTSCTKLEQNWTQSSSPYSRIGS